MEKIHEDFINDFKLLLKKHDAEFNLDFTTEGWSHKDVPTINFNYREDRGFVKDLVLPNYIDKD